MNLNSYTFSLIYKVSSKIGNCVYYGSTTDLMERIRKHKSDYKYNRPCYSKLVLKYPDYKFEIVEYYPCENKKQLNKREGYYQRTYDCVNRNVAGRTRKEHYQDHVEDILKYQKKYRDEHKEKISEKRKIKITCKCGSVVRKSDIRQHERSKKHIKYIKSLNITV